MEKSRRAFTLIELLVVISIIALLLSIIMPSLKAARESARSVVCASNLRQIGLATNLYIGEFKGQYPAVSNWSAGWKALLAPYVARSSMDMLTQQGKNSGNVFICPSSNHPKRTLEKDYQTARLVNMQLSYGITGYLAWGTSMKGISKKINDIKRPHYGVIWMIEGINEGSGGDNYIHGIGGSIRDKEGFLNQMGWRHRKRSLNVLYVDGRVEATERKKGLEVSEFNTW